MTDWLGLDDESTANREPALRTGPPMGPRELLAYEDMLGGSVLPEFEAAFVIAFVDEDGRLDDPEQWAALMGWPAGIEPTSEQVAAFVLNRRAALLARGWARLQKAHEQDQADLAEQRAMQARSRMPPAR